MTYGDLEDKLGAVVLGLKGVQNRGKLVGVELDCKGVSGGRWRDEKLE